MEIKENIVRYINKLLDEYRLTQRNLAKMLGVSPGSLSGYKKGREIPGIQILMKLAEIGDVTIDELLKTGEPSQKGEIIVSIGNIKGDNNIAGHLNVGRDYYHGDVYNNTKVHKTYAYTYQPGDLREDQAAKLKALVEEIVKLEKLVSKNPKSYAAVYNALKKRFKVVYYRKIREEEFPKAQTYLKAWKGRLLKAHDLPQKDNELYRKARYSAIFAAAKNQLGLTKKALDGYIFAEYGVHSIRDLDNTQLEHLYTTVMATKKKKGK